MEDNFKGIEPKVYKSGINVPYAWWAGETASKFFIGLRDDKDILGKKCGNCDKVYIPPRKACPACFNENTEWVKVSDEGTVQAFTVARRQLAALPEKAPVCFGLIKLEGADTSLLHYLGEIDPDSIEIGMKVKAKFSEDRKGVIQDIEYFRPL